jgi:hypothetical protein
MKTLKYFSSGFRVASGYCIALTLRFRKATNGFATRVIILGISFLLGSAEVPGGRAMMTEAMRSQSDRSFFYYQVRHLPFSEDLLKACLDYEGIKYQDIVLLQSRLETGNYTSDIFRNGNNLFGMKYPGLRPTVATGIYREHAQYAHWSDSVIDYSLWQKYYLSRGYRIGSEIDSDFYLVFLNCIPYAEDPRYIRKLVTLSERDVT